MGVRGNTGDDGGEGQRLAEGGGGLVVAVMICASATGKARRKYSTNDLAIANQGQFYMRLCLCCALSLRKD